MLSTKDRGRSDPFPMLVVLTSFGIFVLTIALTWTLGHEMGFQQAIGDSPHLCNTYGTYGARSE